MNITSVITQRVYESPKRSLVFMLCEAARVSSGNLSSWSSLHSMLFAFDLPESQVQSLVTVHKSAIDSSDSSVTGDFFSLLTTTMREWIAQLQSQMATLVYQSRYSTMETALPKIPVK